jgi:hypothetical protein
MIEQTLKQGLRPTELGIDQVVGTILFYNVNDALRRCGDYYGEFEWEGRANVIEVDVSGIPDENFNDFPRVRVSEDYTVFGRHTFATVPIEPSRLTLL